MNPLLTRSFRALRTAAALLALATAGATTSGAAAPEQAPAAAGAVAAAGCQRSAPSTHRLTAEAVASGASDPDDRSTAQTERADSELRSRLADAHRLDRVRARSSSATASRRIDVYVHVITKDNGKGGVSKKRIQEQVRVLNRAYAGKTSAYSFDSGFTFRLKKIDATRRSSWYRWAVPDEDRPETSAAKAKLHRGGMDDLNLYIASLSDKVLGYATFPDETTKAQDGVVLLNTSLPGGSATHYDLGDTAVHETGHWLGLFHTFENGCEPTGDQVADTPSQSDGLNVLSCRNLDTCPGGGKDPVHNFMNYSDDRCMTRFTKGQVARMVQTWEAYRAPGAGS